MSKFVVNVREGVNFRHLPFVQADTKIKALPIGTVVEVLYTKRALADGVTWAYAMHGGIEGWIADANIALAPDGADDPNKPNRHCVGWHCAKGMDDPKGFLDMAERLHKAGNPIPCVKILYLLPNGDMPFSAAELRRRSPTTRIIARILTGGDYRAQDIGGWQNATAEHGRAYFHEHKRWVKDFDLLPYCNSIIWRDLNESSDGNNWDGFNRWTLGLMAGAADYKRETGVDLFLNYYTFPVGNPGLLKDKGKRPDHAFWVQPSTWQVLDTGNRAGHRMVLHQYALNGNFDTTAGSAQDTMYRSSQVFNILPPELRDTPLDIGEAGESWNFGGQPRSRPRYKVIFRTIGHYFDDERGKPMIHLWGLGGWEPWLVDKLDHTLPDYYDFMMEGIG